MEPLWVKSDAPAGRSGEWSVEKFRVAGTAPPGLALPDCFRRRPGVYTRLKHGATVYMTDLYDEWWTQCPAIEEACRRGGGVLVTGLGLGLVALSMLASPGTRVERVTVVEAAGDVVRLVAPSLRARLGGRLQVVHADAFTWRPPAGARFSVGWHDIWPNPHDAARWPEMERLERRYAPFCDWQGSWVRSHLAAAGTGAQPERSDARHHAPR